MIVSWLSAPKEITASSRLRNSGVNMRLIASISSPSLVDGVKPICVRASDSAPALVVITMQTLRKSALRPLLSVKRPVVHDLQQDVEDVRVRLLDLVEQQHRVRLLGDLLGEQAALLEADVPGGAPIRRLTAWRSMYSDMSKRISSMPMQ